MAKLTTQQRLEAAGSGEFPVSLFKSGGTLYSGVAKKLEAANAFRLFVAYDCDEDYWTDGIYKMFSLYFGHIAEYNGKNFYQVWFGDTKSRMRFFTHLNRITLQFAAVDRPDIWSDVVGVIGTWAEEHDLEGIYYDAYRKGETEAELHKLEELIGKYPNNAKCILLFLENGAYHIP